MKKNINNIIYLALICATAILFYASAWTNDNMTLSGRLFWAGFVAVLHSGLSMAIIANWNK